MADRVFELANLLAVIAWALLLTSPWLPRAIDLVCGVLAPAMLAGIYVTGIVWLLTGAPTDAPAVDFTTIDGVATIFATREGLAVAWVHYLAFDLFVGAWEVRVARRDAIAFWLVVPCLVLTFVAGPLGLLLFLCIRLALRRTNHIDGHGAAITLAASSDGAPGRA